MEIHFQLVCQANPLNINVITIIFKIRISTIFLQFFQFDISLSLSLVTRDIIGQEKKPQPVIHDEREREREREKMFLHTGDSRETVSQSVGTRLMRCVISVTATQYRVTLPR